jgi:hypothetical protein
MAGQAPVTAPVRRVIAVSQGRFFDRLVRGRLWIPALGVLLMGIVFVQVSMLSMNADIGRSVKQSSALERANAALRADLSRQVISNSVSDSAAAAGMVVPASGDYHVLTASDSAARRAASSLTAPIAPINSVPAVAATAPTPATTTAAPVTPVATPAQTAPAVTPAGATATPVSQTGASSGGGTAAPGAQG